MKKLLAKLLLATAALAPTVSQADAQFSVLVLAIPTRYHYEYIPVARESFERMAKLHAFDMVWTAQLQALEGDLSKYAAIVFLNTSGEELNEAQRRGVEAYIKGDGKRDGKQRGGNAVIVHRAIISKPGLWPWYEQLVGRSFKIHPMLQSAVVTKADASHPASFALPAQWIWSDEWYEFTNPHGVSIHPILKVDERSYDPTKIWPGQVATGMGADHPVAWSHTHEGARVFVSALGHNAEMYKDPNYLGHLWGGIYWAATGRGETISPLAAMPR